MKSTSHCIPALLVLVLFVSTCSIGCGTNIHSTLVLYDQSEGGRLPVESSSRILMADAITYGVSIPRFDDQRSVGARDTLEIRPGNHRMWLRVSPEKSASGRQTETTDAMLRSSYLLMAFEAEAGQVYELKITGFTPPDWSAELVNQAKPSEIVRSVRTTRLELKQP